MESYRAKVDNNFHSHTTSKTFFLSLIQTILFEKRSIILMAW